ncbi:MAG: cell division protein FtsH [Deltaproteobacteria bacterium]|nr:MAG: cell division protein FtsH [Deltaproteobacteria bacterium]
MHRSLLLWFFIAALAILLFNSLTPPAKQKEIVYSDFLEAVEDGRVVSVTIKGHKVTGQLSDGSAFRTILPPDPQVVPLLRAKGVRIAAKSEETPFLHSFLISWVPILVLIGLWIFFMRQMQAGGGKAFSFGRSRARMFTKDQGKRVTFKDVAGIEESKEEVREIIEFLKDPQKFTKLGGRIPKGILLVGPPGTGKTLLAKAIAGEADVPFLSISGSDFVEMFVGVGASRVRDLFAQAKKNAPCIVFIDEIDAVGRYRGAGLGGGHDEREQTLNQLLVEMDGFESNEGIIVIAATNRPDILDPALLRPGRFDRQVVVPIPDVKGREEILKVHTRNTPLADDVDLGMIARSTPGFTGADLENLVNEAALLAARKNKDRVGMEELEAAKDKVLMGTERKSMIISEEERRDTAYHEAGHALVAKLTPGSDPIHKVSIIPRGQALGVTQQLPTDDRHIYSKEYLLANITTLMGGRAAEEVVLGHFTTGAGNDIERATEIARKMVCEWGMSERLGPLSFGRREEQVFLGKELVMHKDYSEKTAQEIDEEVRRIVNECYERAKGLIEQNIEALHRLAGALLERESLTGDEIEEVLKEAA